MKKNQVTTLVGKEDDTESTATKTTTTFTSSFESESDENMSALMMDPTLSDHTYEFGRRRCVKPACGWRTSAPQVCKKEQSSFKLNTAGYFQARTI